MSSQSTSQTTPPDVLQGYVTEQQLAVMLRRCRRTLERWRTARTGPPITRIGKSVFYRRDGVLDWLRQKEEVRRARRR